jgi:hypothetical protein
MFADRIFELFKFRVNYNGDRIKYSNPSAMLRKLSFAIVSFPLKICKGQVYFRTKSTKGVPRTRSSTAAFGRESLMRCCRSDRTPGLDINCIDLGEIIQKGGGSDCHLVTSGDESCRAAGAALMSRKKDQQQPRRR